ncbi:hypothetical protein [Bradyrhizobium iriomotense]|uniref:Uncharacterized protein n=1 Tax=Bradyrhizobium iriomotense TaxID=441950 RepID=A0ABQ6BBF1_9BRAD|nr:hypothetical protein [Bradyrhizobium iriomotense]GLR90826.1 hypothetical protein GCM10007857_75420 [Bradyrhizobium iriomotense]
MIRIAATIQTDDSLHARTAFHPPGFSYLVSDMVHVASVSSDFADGRLPSIAAAMLTTALFRGEPKIKHTQCQIRTDDVL